jgi:hypothetical protein
MEKFWKWMKEKGYATINTYTKRIIICNIWKEKIPNQMLIGYMIEYIRDKIKDVVSKKAPEDMIIYYSKSEILERMKYIWLKEDPYEELKEIIEMIEE